MLFVSLWWMAAALIVLGVVGLVLSGLRIIDEREAGLVVRRYGPSLGAGRLIALER